MPIQPAAPIPERPILVVDDDAKIVRLVRTYLERDGFSVVTASDGPAPSTPSSATGRRSSSST